MLRVVRTLLATHALLSAAACHAAAASSAMPDLDKWTEEWVGADRPDVIRVKCRAFLDLSEDGIRQLGEPALAGIEITNGVQILRTDTQGEVTVSVDRNVYRFATLTIPAGYWPTNQWYHWVPVGTTGPDTAEFGLKSFPPTAADPIRWVHISDTQTQSWGQAPEVETDLQAINRLLEPPLFIVHTGDLVENRSDPTHWEHYLDQLRTSNYPVFSVPGNHDRTPTPPHLEAYERFIGPPYYNIQAGSWNFLFLNREFPDVATPAQDVWLDNVIAAAPAGVHHIMFQHYMMADMPSAKARAFAARGIEACFSGHWHSLSISRHENGMMDFNLSRTSMGPLDRTPRSFAIVTLKPTGEIDYELRRLAVDHRVEIVSPQAGQVVSGERIEVLVQAYDTSSPVSDMTAEIVGPAGVAALSPMVQEGVSLWRAMIDVSNAPRGEYSVHLGGSFQDGRLIRSQSQFERRDVVPIVRAIGEDWPMFRKSAAGSSYTAVRVKPPLELAWTTPVPGMVALNSPVVANGKVFLGCRTETGDLRQSGIVCCDAITGAIEWYAPIPGGVALSPAVADNVVLVTAITDSVFGLNAATGETLWRKRTPGNKYKMTAPIFEGTTAWMGSEPAPIEIDTASGQVRWTSEVLGSAWYPAIYSAPAVNEDYVYFSFYGTPGRARDGFSVVDRQTGTIIYHENGTFRSPICAGDTVFVVTTHGPVAHALTARDRLGNVLWTSATKLGFGTGAPALGHGVIVVPGANGKIEALRASDGTHLWSHAVGFSLYDMWPNRRYQRDTIGSVAITDSVVYAGSADGNLYGLDLGSGTELWRWYFGTPIASTPAASGNMLFVGASDGHLYAFVETAVGVPRPTADLARSVPARSNHFALYAPTPNPTVSAVEFEWVMPARARVRIDICDVAGRRIRKLLEEEREAGEHLVSWDGRDDRGVDSASGIYFVRLVAGESVALRKLVYLGR